MSFDQHQLPASGSAKVPIPRLERGNERTRNPHSPRLTRVPRACLSCRTRKVKCNGVRPKCQNCVENTTPCVYAASRKDRLKTATDHNQDMLRLLRDLRPSLGAVEKQRVDNLLSEVADSITDAALTLQKTSNTGRDVEENEGEADISAEVGSSEDLDNKDEDFLRNAQSRATGYVGKNSEVQWLRRLHHEADAGPNRASHEGPYGPPGTSPQAFAERTDAMYQRRAKNPIPRVHTSSCSFYLDEEPLDLGVTVDPLELPPFETADKLLKCYMHSVQNSFPIIEKRTFVRRFYHYYDSAIRGSAYKPPKKWQAILNVVFAIGATYSHLIKADWRADENDHLIYHNRAWTLSLTDPRSFTNPDLAQTQIIGLLSFYYVAIGHVNRAWIVMGMALRFGIALGLHIRNEDLSATAVEKETLIRTWWSIYSLERILSATTGRPSIDTGMYYSAMLPLPISCEEIDEAIIQDRFGWQPRYTSFRETPSPEKGSSPVNMHEPANSGTFLTSTVKLGMLQQKVLAEIYSPSVVTQSWKDVQGTIAQLLEDLETWVTRLPAGLAPFHTDDSTQPMQHERNILRAYYYSTKILISRPCLCRIDRRIAQQTQSSADFNHKIAITCVESAMAVAALLPDDMINETNKIYNIFPWWAAIHYTMQSVAILLLETCYQFNGPEIVPALKKLVRWLRALKTSNGMARRGYLIIMDLLKKLVDRVKFDMSDIFAEDSPEEENPLEQTLDPSPLWFTGDEFLEQYPQQPPDPYSNMMPSVNFPPASIDPTLQGLPHELLNSHSPVANLFVTIFDQHNPLSLDDNDVEMHNYQG